MSQSNTSPPAEKPPMQTKTDVMNTLNLLRGSLVVSRNAIIDHIREQRCKKDEENLKGAVSLLHEESIDVTRVIELLNRLPESVFVDLAQANPAGTEEVRG